MSRKFHVFLPVLACILLVIIVYNNLNVEFLTSNDYLTKNRQRHQIEVQRILRQDDAMLILTNYLGRRHPINVMDQKSIYETSILLPYLLPSEIEVTYEVSAESNLLYDLDFSHKDVDIEDDYNMSYYSSFDGYRLFYKDINDGHKYSYNVCIDKISHDIILFTKSQKIKTYDMNNPKLAVDNFINEEPLFFNRQYDRVDRYEDYFRSIVRIPSLNKTYVISFINGDNPLYIMLDYEYADELTNAMKVYNIIMSTANETESERIQ